MPRYCWETSEDGYYFQVIESFGHRLRPFNSLERHGFVSFSKLHLDTGKYGFLCAAFLVWFVMVLL